MITTGDRLPDATLMETTEFGEACPLSPKPVNTTEAAKIDRLAFAVTDFESANNGMKPKLSASQCCSGVRCGTNQNSPHSPKTTLGTAASKSVT